MTEACDIRAAAPSQPDPAVGIPQVILPESLSSRQATELFGELVALRGRAIVIDATAVRQVGTLCLQILASARRTWMSDGLDFRMRGVPEGLSEQWQLFGLPVGGSAGGVG
ncbi:STAS domain-containing protein [uncultured Brevundimonas sp.]|uniref:STAS domain-containing protein n=1 Tax=uncultured Brevundimonas sp. TaxID=213418 RepID=UPI0030EEA5F2|tara:strand:- start:9097 stop:9429 length:333 start_codon:yes stop_codon:yes gene_type:complete